MKNFLCLVAATIAMIPLTSPASAQPAPTFPGFSCERLAKRQPITIAPATTFRVEKKTYTPEFKGSEHSIKGGEIVYLLSGGGSVLMSGAATQLSTKRAIYIPGGVMHDFRPEAGSTLTVLSVQFSDKTSKDYKPKRHDPFICKD